MKLAPAGVTAHHLPRGQSMAYQPKYLQKIKAGRGIRPVGEAFAMHFNGVGYLFGRVIRNDCGNGGITDPRPWPREPGLYLVYIYKDISNSIDEVPPLKRSRLLIPPEIIGGGGWTRGYFAPVRRDPLTPEDVFPTHCFRVDFIRLIGMPPVTYVDEFGDWLDKPSEPCGGWGLGGYGSIETAVAKALGLPHPELPGSGAASAAAKLPPVDLASIPAGTSDGECSVVLYLPGGPGTMGLDKVEDALIAAVERAKAGEWVGHGTDLETGTFDVQFDGPDGRALLLAIKQGLRPLRRHLPPGWYVTARIGEDGEERRVRI